LASNYDSYFDEKQPVAQQPPRAQQGELSPHNTWFVRTVLKGMSGIFIAIPVFPILFGALGYTFFDFSMLALTSLVFGIICWMMFYQLESEYRRYNPDYIS
jgi:hypothetical protein